jgi:hypothetical protein
MRPLFVTTLVALLCICCGCSAGSLGSVTPSSEVQTAHLSTLQRNLLSAESRAAFQTLLEDIQRSEPTDEELRTIESSLEAWSETSRDLTDAYLVCMLPSVDVGGPFMGAPLIRSYTSHGRPIRELFGRCPALLEATNFITVVDLNELQVGPDDIETLSDLYHEGHLQSVRHLNLRNSGVGDDELRTIANMSSLRLESIDLRGNDVTDAGLQTLISSDVSKSLVHLDLSFTNIGPGGIGALLQEPPRGLESLILRFVDLSTDPLVLSLDGSSLELKELDLTYTRIGIVGLLALAKSPLLRSVEVLNLDGISVEEGFADFLEAAPLDSLRVLAVGGVFGEDLPQILATSPLQLRELSLVGRRTRTFDPLPLLQTDAFQHFDFLCVDGEVFVDRLRDQGKLPRNPATYC